MAKYDFMSFGEAMVRFTPPGHDRLGQAEELQLGIAAAELNCCVNISNLSRKLLKPQLKTAFVTKMVDAWDGDYIIKHAQMHGVDMSNVVVMPYDKIGRNGRNGKCFIEVGIGPRPSYQTYDRGHSAVSRIKPGDIDWEKVLDTRWFHSTGIVTAVGEYTAQEVGAALKAAKECKGKPTLILAKTTKGKGVSYMENEASWHGAAPNDEQYAQAMREVEAGLQ